MRNLPMTKPTDTDFDQHSDRTDKQFLAQRQASESLVADAYNLMPKSNDQQYEVPKGKASVEGVAGTTVTFDLNQMGNDLRLNPYTNLRGPEQEIGNTGVAQYRVMAQEYLKQNHPDLAVQSLCQELKVLQQFPTSQSGRLMYSALNSLGDIALLSGDCNSARQLFTLANNCIQGYLTARIGEAAPGSAEQTRLQQSEAIANASLQARVQAANSFEYALSHPQQPPQGMDAAAIQQYQQYVNAWQSQVNQQMFNTAIQSMPR